MAAYCRVSTDKDDQANSLLSQRSYFEQYIQSRSDWTLKEVYYDDGISGTSTNHRDSFNRMIDDALNGQIDLIITKEVSRFARNTVDTLSLTRRLKDRDVGVIFITDNIDTRDSDGELRLSIMASIAQEESRKTSERVKWGQKRRMEDGVVFGRDMLGYTVKKGKLNIKPDEAETVRLIFRKFLVEGKGTHVIARELREAGITPMRVKDWSNTIILRVLRNEKYVGDLCQKKTYTPNYLNHLKKYNRGNEEKVYLFDHHEPIVDRETWNAVQDELARRSLTKEQKSKHSIRYWCSGKIVCGECGRRFVSRTKKLRSGEKYKAWRCYEGAMHGQLQTDAMGRRIGCANGSVNEKVLTEAVSYCLKIIQRNCVDIKEDMYGEIRKVQSVLETDNSAQLRKSIADYEAKKAKAIDLVLDGFIAKSELQAQLEYYDTEIAVIQGRLDERANAEAIRKRQMKTVRDYISEIDRILLFDASNTALFGSMLDRIVVYKENVLEVRLKSIPFGFGLEYRSCGKGSGYRTEFVLRETE